MDEAPPRYLPGRLFIIPLAHIAAAGGLAGVYENFASRARAYFRDRGEECTICPAAKRSLYIQRGRRTAAPPEVALMFRERETRAACVCVSLTAEWPSVWTDAHEAFAEMVANWPEIAGFERMPRPAATCAFTEEEVETALAIVLRDQRVSTSYIQRRMRIGYQKAAYIIEALEQRGAISAADQSGKRTVLAKP